MLESGTTLVESGFEPERQGLCALLASASAREAKHVYLVWNPLSTLFRFKASDVEANLAKLFQPGVYDLLVLHSDLAWALFLMHYGEVRFTRLLGTDGRPSGSTNGELP